VGWRCLLASSLSSHPFLSWVPARPERPCRHTHTHTHTRIRTCRMLASTSGRGGLAAPSPRARQPRGPWRPRRPPAAVAAASASGGGDGADATHPRAPRRRHPVCRSPSPPRAAAPSAAPAAPVRPHQAGGVAPVASPIVTVGDTATALPATSAPPARASQPAPPPPPPVSEDDVEAELAYLDGLVAGLRGLEGEAKVKRREASARAANSRLQNSPPAREHLSSFSLSLSFSPSVAGRRPPPQRPGPGVRGRVQVSGERK
jgi:hypothetical protein